MEERKVEKKNFDFVDTIRCISMVGIIFEHSAAVGAGGYSNVLDTAVENSLIQSFKFCTIAFFLIGGFLINHKFQEYTPKQYLKNRFRSTIKPWLLWLFIYVLWMVLERYIAFLRGSTSIDIESKFFVYVWEFFVKGIFYTSSWFVLNFLICICILLIFKRYLYNWWFGAILGLISLVYSFNLYHNWFITNHSTALFGFVFYLWLGVMMNKYYASVMSYIKNRSWLLVVSVCIILFVLAVMESFLLSSLGQDDVYNTLRLSNILYSFAIFAFLLKCGSSPWIDKYMQPRQTTFGIYLVHYVLVVRFLPLIFQPMKLKYENYSVWVNSGFHILQFVIVYALSFTIVQLVRRTKYKWIVGA